MKIFKYSSIQVCKYASIQVCKSMQVCKSVQVFKCSSVQVFKYSSKYSSIQVFKSKWLLTYNVKARDPVGSKKFRKITKAPISTPPLISKYPSLPL